jgi:hypothetical protein
MTTFNNKMTKHQKRWRKTHIKCQKWGRQCGVERAWILPRHKWEESLWPDIRSGSSNSLPQYLKDRKVQKHQGVHNLKSSWVLCANLYFPFRSEHGLPILTSFLKEYVSPSIEAVEAVELEYEEESPYNPPTLLGEPGGGRRGTNQTSPDVAFKVQTIEGVGLILTENKLVEHSFYPCSGRSRAVRNPDIGRCMDWQKLLADLPGQCWQLRWEKGERKNRKYWDHIQLSDHGQRVLTRCPAATAGYQLFRQQALAEGIAAGGRYDLVVSCVAYDARNTELIHCLRTSGVDNFADGWSALFDGKARFSTFTHQQWIAWVQDHDPEGWWRDWLEYVKARYGYH